MSLLLDALKKSEAQRRRGKPPAADLAATPPPAGPERSGWRWLKFLWPAVVLVAAAPWLWPEISSRLADGRAVDGGAEQTAARSAPGATAPAARAGQGPIPAVSAPQDQTTPLQAPSPVAGAGRARAAAADDTDETGRAAGARGGEAAPAQKPAAPEPSRPAMSTPGDAPDSKREPDLSTKLAREFGAESESESEPRSEPESESEPEPKAEDEPRENFIRSWELPQARRAEFPDLNLTVHFYTEAAGDRFVRINGERYAEGQQVGPGTELIEIRDRGAVVEFAGYRVLIE